MSPTNTYRKQFILFYFICFAVTYLWLFYNGLLLQQLKPVFFLNNLDFSRNILMLTDIQHAVINNPWLQVIFDTIYIISPIALVICSILNYRAQYLIAVFNSIFNFIYAMLITSMSTLSIEGYISWILIPLVFAFRSGGTFFYMVQIMRYFFLMIFVSAALWKIRAGGIFNMEQMSAILVRQHTGYLLSDPGDWFSRFISFLAVHTRLSWCIYLGATISELFFIIGFFIKKYDRFIIAIFILFLAFNFLLMRINYISWVVFTGCIWFAQFDNLNPAIGRGKHFSDSLNI